MELEHKRMSNDEGNEEDETVEEGPEEDEWSKATWIKLGDDNTRYFFSIIKHMKLQQDIIQLRDNYGRLQSDQEDIAQILVDFYKDLLAKKEKERTNAFGGFLKNGYILSIEDQLKLLRPYTTNDVKELRLMGKDLAFLKGEEGRDDLMVFCKGNLASITKVMEALNHFSFVTGLVANLEKSNIFLDGIEEDEHARILQ
ncbi:uncharacterized protein [Nicotiana sylvestris]|uniref:uncharacterized protein n=1 Tax=Nicotiana sylvestris TaxID=4096 RepID=UPI00388C355A